MDGSDGFNEITIFDNTQTSTFAFIASTLFIIVIFKKLQYIPILTCTRKTIQLSYFYIVFHHYDFLLPYQIYMIKFILERYATPTNQQLQASDQPITLSQNPQINKSTVALRNLKQTEDHIDSLRRRLSVLQIRDKKNQNKAKQNQRKWQFHTRIQQQIEKNKNMKSRHLNRKNQELSLSKQRIQQQRNYRNQNLNSVKQDLLTFKRSQREKQKNQSLSHSRSIEKMKLQDLNTKIHQSKIIKQSQIAQKEHIEEYFLHKRNNFRQKSARQGDRFDSQRSSRSKLLQQLTTRQNKLIQRQSTSRAALDQSIQRLYKITTIKSKPKQQKSTSDMSERLPPISARHTQQYLFI